MIRHWGFACLSASLGLALACEKGSNVEAETRDLAEAQKNTGNVAQDLEAQLEKARAEVVELEKKLGLAREGITDDVLQQRAELQQALDSQRRELQEDINEAQREAQALNKDTDRAIQQLQQTQAQVDNRLDTEANIPPVEQPLDSPTREEIAPVRGVDTPPPPAPPVEEPTTTSPASPPPALPPAASPPAPSSPAPAPDPAVPPPSAPAAPPSTDPAPVAPVPAP